MRNEGKVLSRTQILDHVWGYESWPESNLVPVYVTYLRRKFARLNIPVEIRSVRGVGYVLGGDDV
jgi:DNA-binding response OmpR family regulator